MRKGWDSNPRSACADTCFQDKRTSPLCDPSHMQVLYKSACAEKQSDEAEGTGFEPVRALFRLKGLAIPRF